MADIGGAYEIGKLYIIREALLSYKLAAKNHTRIQGYELNIIMYY